VAVQAGQFYNQKCTPRSTTPGTLPSACPQAPHSLLRFEISESLIIKLVMSSCYLKPFPTSSPQLSAWCCRHFKVENTKVLEGQHFEYDHHS